MPTSSSNGSGRGVHLAWLSALGVLLAAAALITPQVDGADATASAPSAVRAPQVAPSVPAPVTPTVEPDVALRPETRPPTPPQRPAAGPPRRLVVPKLGIDSPVIGIEADDGVLLPPDDPQVLGWWTSGAVPGAGVGGALITGHTVSTGGGAFDHLETLRRGDRVRVRTTNGVVDYAVTTIRIYRKAALARHAQDVFSQSVPGRLVLVTCEDWNGSAYLSNAVVTAEPVSPTTNK